MRRFAPSKRLILLWRLRLFAAMLAFAFFCGALFFFFAAAAAALGAFLLAAGLLLWFWYLPRLFASYEICVSPRAVSVARGVIFFRKYVLPAPSLIYAQQCRTPLERLLRLCTVRLLTVRGRLRLPALPEEDARRLLALLEPENPAPEPPW